MTIRALDYSFGMIVPLVLGCRSTPAAVTHADSADAAPPPASAEAPRTAGQKLPGPNPGGAGRGSPLAPRSGNELAAFAAGCFWGIEDAYRKVPGVVATAVGYAGGRTDEPTYEDVCAHGTGHAETVLVEFDPKAVTYERLVRIFFKIHDPTTADRQGPDVGDQYRSAVFTFSDDQAKAVRTVMSDVQPRLPARIVTQVAPIPRFWIAEGYHQQYAERTGHHGCPTGSFEDL